MSKWTKEKIQEFQAFKHLVESRLALGESENSAFRDSPSGFSEWLRENFKETGGIKLPKLEDIPTYKCWNCGNEYRGRACPFCKAFKPREQR